MIINRVRPLSVGKIAAFLYGIVGLFIGAVIAVFALFGGLMTGAAGAANDAQGPGAAFGALFGVAGVAAIVIAPIFYGIMGFSARSSWPPSTTWCRASSAGSRSTSASAGQRHRRRRLSDRCRSIYDRRHAREVGPRRRGAVLRRVR